MIQKITPYRLLIIGVLLLLITPYITTKFDLSEEKKFSLSESSIQIIKQLNSPIKVKVFLDDENTPGGFKRLHKALISTLEELKSNSKVPFQIEQIHIYKDYPTDQDRQNLAFYLDSLGIPPTNVVNNENGKKTQLMVFPGIVIEKDNHVSGALILKGNKLNTSQEILNQSIEGLEYEIIQALQSIQTDSRKKIGFLLDYSQVPALRQMDLIRAMKKKYDLYPVDLGQSATLEGLDAICLIQPSKSFSTKDVFKIDQFLVKGGKAIFLMDGCKVDTVQQQGLVFTSNESGLEEFFFRNGIRLNSNIIKDAQLSGAIPLIVGNFGDKPNMQLMPWPAFPLVEGNPTNIISKNLDAVYSKFISSIDTFATNGLQKTILLSSSKLSKLQKSPATLPFSASGKDFDPKNYTDGSQIAAVLNQGYFQTIFKNRPIPNDSLKNYYQEKTSKKGAFILVGDADIALNELDPKSHQPLTLGYDLFSQHTFANKDFIMNAFAYLLDEQQSLMARNKEVKLRPLDKEKITKERSFWQTINLISPLIFAMFIGYLVIFYRKKKYSR